MQDKMLFRPCGNFLTSPTLCDKLLIYLLACNLKARRRKNLLCTVGMLYTGLTTHKQPSCYNTSNCCLRRFWNRASIWQCNTMANVVVTNTFSADQGCPWHVHTKLCSSPLLSVWITAICMQEASIKLSEYQTFWRRWPSKNFICMQQWRQSRFDWLPKAMRFCPCPA